MRNQKKFAEGEVFSVTNQATHIIVFTQNANGESTESLSVQIKDQSNLAPNISPIVSQVVYENVAIAEINASDANTGGDTDVDGDGDSTC